MVVQLHSMIQRKKQILEPHHVQEILSLDNYGDYNNTLLDDYNGNGNMEGNMKGNMNDNNTRHTLIEKSSFDQKLLFHEFVKTICSTSTIPRKEMYEAWAAALTIQEEFPNERRIADLACGHGLLSWALLLLDLEGEKESNFNAEIDNGKSGGDNGRDSDSYSDSDKSKIYRTAICIDRRMPKSAEKIAKAMLKQRPELKDRWDFVESKLDCIIPSSTTLLCGVHACGILSDQIISLAMSGNAPLALIPCCHAKKSMNDFERYEFDRIRSSSSRNKGYDHSQAETDNSNDIDIGISLGGYIDNLRMKRLKSSGYHVIRKEIPKEYTPQNTVILASPPPTSSSSSSSPSTERQKSMHIQQSRQMRNQKRPANPNLFSVPIGNDCKSIATIKTLSGRKAADLRKAPPVPSLCVSMFMTESGLITPESLLTNIESVWEDSNVKIHIEYADDGAYLHPNGLYARTFRLSYLEENSERIDKERAKQLHSEFCNKIISLIEGITIRG